jgi:cytochrome d ubiquinol oxidase subunit I
MILDPATMLAFARFLFAFTIGSHILLVSTSISLIVLISVAEYLSIRQKDGVYDRLARRLSKVFVVSFGIGTASGIVMAVELVTLFPKFMTLVAQTGVIVLFYAEVFAFFLEVLALVLYVYYWNSFRRKWVHWGVSLLIASGTIISAVFITMVNAWMNTPNGFDIATYIGSGLTTVSQVEPWAAFMTSSAASQVIHVLVTTLFAGTMVVGSYFAFWYLRSRDQGDRAMLGRAMKILGVVATITILLSGLTGSNEMATLLSGQPLKYAALDANINPGANLPDRFFGTIVNGTYVGGFSVTGMQSLLAHFETGLSELPGLSQFPTSTWPPLLVHTTFNIMTVGGIALGLFFFAYFVGILRRKKPNESRLFLILWIPLAVLAAIVYELGWATDEIGRQPWIVYNVMSVGQAANTSPSIFVPGILVVLFYLLMVPSAFYLYARVFKGRVGQQEV